MSTKLGKREVSARRLPVLRLLAAAAFFLCGAGGCTWDRWNLFQSDAPPPPPQDSVVLRGDKLEPDKTAAGRGADLLASAHELYRKDDFKRAERAFHKIAENTKNAPHIMEEARYYEADCLRRQGKLPKAADTYHKQLIDFPSGAYREQAAQHMFDIANYWLLDTRKEMELTKKKKEGEVTVVWPEWVHLDKEKPLIDEEGRAIEKLEQVRLSDMTGPLADKSLFLSGSVKFFREDYKEADHYYSQLVEMHPNSPYAPQALKLAMICKQMCTGGPLYDGRKLAEARKLVDTAFRTYPELAQKESDFLNRQLVSINLQQAAKDYESADFYRRTGHPCSAYFCYEVVRRRYPGTKYFDLATERMHELKGKLEKDGGKDQPPAVPPAPGPNETVLPMPSRLAPGDGVGVQPRQLPPGIN